MQQEEILERLKEGNKRFVADRLDGKLQNSERRKDLVGSQSPFAIVLGCADSRVVPEIVFDTGLGELFVIRVAGNIANSSSVASIEYAVANLNTQVLIVLGHQSCGAVHAAIQGGNSGANLNHLLAHVQEAIQECGPDASVNDVVKANANIQAKDVVLKSQIIQDAFEMGQLQIVPAYYNLETGAVEFLS